MFFFIVGLIIVGLFLFVCILYWVITTYDNNSTDRLHQERYEKSQKDYADILFDIADKTTVRAYGFSGTMYKTRMYNLLGPEKIQQMKTEHMRKYPTD